MSRSTKKVWNDANSLYVCQSMFDAFGPTKYWKSNGKYPKGKKDEFEVLMLKISKEIKEKYGTEVESGAIKDQLSMISWQKKITKRYYKAYIRMRNAAINSGLLSNKSFPELIQSRPDF